MGQLRLPQTVQRILVSKMMLRNGETGVIGGLRQEIEATTTTKVPLLGDIPIIGWLFRHRAQTRQVSDLMILVTPNVIDLQRDDTLSRQFDQVQREMRAESFESRE